MVMPIMVFVALLYLVVATTHAGIDSTITGLLWGVAVAQTILGVLYPRGSRATKKWVVGIGIACLLFGTLMLILGW